MLFDAFGLIGSALIVGAYAAQQLGKVTADSLAYSLMNALGALLILVSLSVAFNLSAAVVEVFWLLISLRGIVMAARAGPAASVLKDGMKDGVDDGVEDIATDIAESALESGE